MWGTVPPPPHRKQRPAQQQRVSAWPAVKPATVVSYRSPDSVAHYNWVASRPHARHNGAHKPLHTAPRTPPSHAAVRRSEYGLSSRSIVSAQCSELNPSKCLSSLQRRRARAYAHAGGRTRPHEKGAALALSENYHPRQHTSVELQRLRASSRSQTHTHTQAYTQEHMPRQPRARGHAVTGRGSSAQNAPRQPARVTARRVGVYLPLLKSSRSHQRGPRNVRRRSRACVAGGEWDTGGHGRRERGRRWE